MQGRLISLEGGEGAGKSTVLAAVDQHLRAAGIDVLRTREPGGTPLGEAVRTLLLDRSHRVCPMSELLLMFASRAQLVADVVRPALDAGRWVLADRFTDASFAYQGGGRGLDAGWIAELERRVVGLLPDLTLWLDVDVDTGLARVAQRGGEKDRMETESQAFFERVRAAYRDRALADPARFARIDAAASPADVARQATAAVDRLLAARSGPSA